MARPRHPGWRGCVPPPRPASRTAPPPGPAPRAYLSSCFALVASRSPSPRQRELQPASQARLVVQHLDMRAVQAGDGGDQAKPEPVTRRVAAALQPIEALKHVLALVVGNAGSVVGDGDHRAAI